MIKYTALALLGATVSANDDILYAETRNSGQSESKVFTGPSTKTGGTHAPLTKTGENTQTSVSEDVFLQDEESAVNQANSDNSGDDFLYAETRSSGDDSEKTFTMPMTASGQSYDGDDYYYEEEFDFSGP
jgi:hypothetical protein